MKKLNIVLSVFRPELKENEEENKNIKTTKTSYATNETNSRKVTNVQGTNEVAYHTNTIKKVLFFMPLVGHLILSEKNYQKLKMQVTQPYKLLQFKNVL